jgi:hypothetical protein
VVGEVEVGRILFEDIYSFIAVCRIASRNDQNLGWTDPARYFSFAGKGDLLMHEIRAAPNWRS